MRLNILKASSQLHLLCSHLCRQNEKKTWLTLSKNVITQGQLHCDYSSRRQDVKESNHISPPEWDELFQLPEPELDWNFLLNKENRDVIAENIANRKGVGNINNLLTLADELEAEQNITRKKALREKVIAEALDIPNMSHPSSPIGDESHATVIDTVGSQRTFDFKARMIREIAGKGLKMFRDENLTFATGSKTYFLEDDLARLEQALAAFTVDCLLKKGFELVSVPDLLQCGIVDSCGFKTSTTRSQVYRLHPSCFPDVCLSGTAEMALAGYFMNSVFPYEDLPKKVMAVSRCYRAEAAEKAIERGLYRVHHFTKVEMFGVTAAENSTESNSLLQEILSIERDLFDELGLYFRILEMPTQELGAPAHRKYDIEAWLHGKNIWGEISSCSNCTDFQSRRLNIKYMSPTGELKHCHTVNGTGCAVPRMIIAILEQNQQQGRKLHLPSALWPYMDGQTELVAEGRLKNWYTHIKTLKKV